MEMLTLLNCWQNRGPWTQGQNPKLQAVSQSPAPPSSPEMGPGAGGAGKVLLVASGHESITGKRKSESVVFQDFSEPSSPRDKILVLKITKSDKERRKYSILT